MEDQSLVAMPTSLGTTDHFQGSLLLDAVKSHLPAGTGESEVCLFHRKLMDSVAGSGHFPQDREPGSCTQRIHPRQEFLWGSN